ncbi:MAG: RNA polymerase I enhancer binding protein [Chrysothrix sp. TS-e1954]|nr:MAG: RNA polymerase I enhancer binding protein [Chrysothrix sp. TS-e1954]
MARPSKKSKKALAAAAEAQAESDAQALNDVIDPELAKERPIEVRVAEALQPEMAAPPMPSMSSNAAQKKKSDKSTKAPRPKKEETLGRTIRRALGKPEPSKYDWSVRPRTPPGGWTLEASDKAMAEALARAQAKAHAKAHPNAQPVTQPSTQPSVQPTAQPSRDLDEIASTAQGTALAAEQLQRLSEGASLAVNGGMPTTEAKQPTPLDAETPYDGQAVNVAAPKKSRKRKRKEKEPQPDPDTVVEPSESVYPPVEPLVPNKEPEPEPSDEADIDIGAFPESGPFSATEIKRIENYTKGFQERHDLSDVQLNNLVQDNNRKPQNIIPAFWQGLQERLPKRNITAIRKRCRRKYHNYEKRGLWDAEEDEKLQRSYEAKPDKWVEIGSMMERMPEDCRDRWRNYLACGDQRKKQEWTQKEEKELESAVTDCMNDIRSDERRKAREKGRAFRDDQDWESKINFNVVSTKLNHTRSRLQCYQHWKTMKHRLDKLEERADKMKDAEGAEPDAAVVPKGKGKAWREAENNARYQKMLPGDKWKIIQQLSASDSFDEDSIRWAKLKRENPDSRWNTADRKFALERMKELVPTQPNLEETFKKITEYLQDNHGEELDQFYDGPLDGRPRTASRKKKRKAETEVDQEVDALNDSTVANTGDAPPDGPVKKRARRSKKRTKASKAVTAASPTGSVDSVLGPQDDQSSNPTFVAQSANMLTEGMPMAPMAQMRNDEPIDPQLETQRASVERELKA